LISIANADFLQVFLFIFLRISIINTEIFYSASIITM
jgi:hypothetical protein